MAHPYWPVSGIRLIAGEIEPRPTTGTRAAPTVDDMPRLRMTRDMWVARHHNHGVRIEGVAACRHMF